MRIIANCKLLSSTLSMFEFCEVKSKYKFPMFQIICNYETNTHPVCLSNVSKITLRYFKRNQAVFFCQHLFFVFSGPPEYGEDSCGYSLPSCSLQPALQSAYPKWQWWSDRQHHQVQKPITDSSEHNISTQLSDLILTVTLHRIHQGPGPHLS